MTPATFAPSGERPLYLKVVKGRHLGSEWDGGTGHKRLARRFTAAPLASPSGRGGRAQRGRRGQTTIIRSYYSKKAARPSQSPAVTALPKGEPRVCAPLHRRIPRRGDAPQGYLFRFAPRNDTAARWERRVNRGGRRPGRPPGRGRRTERCQRTRCGPPPGGGGTGPW